jgi:alpha-ketoglutarate-dependent taurine dioxygenase
VNTKKGPTLTLHVSPLASTFGAEVYGFDPSTIPGDDAQRLLHAAFDEFGVLVFRGLDLDRVMQTYLTELVRGEHDLSEEKIAADAERQSSFYISNKIEDAAAPFGRLMWHSDGMWSDHPFEVISLYGEAIEPPVPPTRFASTTRAWDSLSSELRAAVENASAVQVPGPENFAHRRGDDDGDLVQPVRDKDYSVTKPVARRHPRTGRTILYVSQQMTSHIDGVSPEQSESLLKDLFEQMYAPTNMIEHDWREGDLVLWDNLACQHARPDVKVDSSVRTLRKVGWPLPPMAEKQAVGTYRRIAAST